MNGRIKLSYRSYKTLTEEEQEMVMIFKKLVVGFIAANCYIIGSEATKEGMIIDPGDEPEKILKAVKELGLKIKLIVLTHHHDDHVGAAQQVKKATGATLVAHTDAEKEVPSYESPLHLDNTLKGGDVIDIGDLHFTVIHTPGHSMSGISIVGEGVVFTGDTLFNFGIGRYDLIDGDYRQLMDGIRNKLLNLPPETVVHPGHGPDSTIATEKRANPFLK